MGPALKLSDEELSLIETHLCRSIYGFPHKGTPPPPARQVFGGAKVMALLEKIKNHNKK